MASPAPAASQPTRAAFPGFFWKEERMEIDAFKTALVALALVVGAPTAMAAHEAVASAAQSQAAKKTDKATRPAKVIDINSASKAELTKLQGVDAAAAERIIAGRPYRSKADLATRKILPTGIYFANRKRIMARQDLTPSPGSGGK